MTDTVDQRRTLLTEFYALLDALEKAIGGERRICDCTGRMKWPARGVYFFREDGEMRTDSGHGPRIVRVGTHGLKARSRTTIWRRLSQHKGSKSGGNHRASIFRFIVGSALMARDGLDFPTWPDRDAVRRDVAAPEHALECNVSATIGRMTFLWLPVPDEPGPESLRSYIERNAIGLLSNYGKPALDSPSEGWLGRHCDRERVRASGLWNSNHVDEPSNPAFLSQMEMLVTAAGATPRPQPERPVIL